MSNRTPAQTLLLVIGVLVLLGGLGCVAVGFADFASADSASDGGSSMLLFAGGAFAAVVGFGIVAFTRASVLTRNGAYTRVTIEQGSAPGSRSCSGCGRATTSSARFCESCGAAVG